MINQFIIRTQNLTKRFGDVLAVDRLSLSLERGEMLALLGPSGSGKTTTLRLLAGFENADSGRVWVENEDVTNVEPVARRFGMVFQHYALFPHLDVGENVAFGLESLGVRATQLGERVARALTLVDLSGFERRRIGQLSGGQQQRVALARALAPEPSRRCRRTWAFRLSGRAAPRSRRPCRWCSRVRDRVASALRPSPSA